jgi:oligopeptidase A
LAGRNWLPIRNSVSPKFARSCRRSHRVFQTTCSTPRNAFAHYVETSQDVSGIPADVLETARAAAKGDGKAGWKFTLHAPSLMPVLQYADNRALEKTMYTANATRASELGNPEWDNTA